MIVLGDLRNRRYDGPGGKDCVAFDFEAMDDSEKLMFVARFSRIVDPLLGDPNEWNMQIVLNKSRDADSQVYTFEYVMPKENLPLPLIAATGLRFFQLHLKDEIQMKHEFEFGIGQIVAGM